MVYKNLDEVLNTFADTTISNARKNLVDDRKSFGALYENLSYVYEKETGLFILEFLMEDYGIFVDKGVRGLTSTYPETASALSSFQYGSGTGPKGGLTKGINEWLQKKRFQWRTKEGKFMSYKSMTYIIARSIYNKGIKANLFFTKPFEDGVKMLKSKLEKAYTLDVEEAILKVAKKSL
jgi:hypothetical protein